MKRTIITTADGSKTIHINEWNEQYHSTHGAINEANYVYLKQGLLYFLSHFCYSERSQESIKNEISILEIGFGTGLNAFLTLIEAEKLKHYISYVGVEAFPVKNEELELLNFSELISNNHQAEFEQLHASKWEETVQISNYFKLKKQQKLFENINAISKFDVIYFDAFGPRVQPNLWTEDIFKIMYRAMKPNGVLTTYSAKGNARRAMQTVGFEVERLDGPPNKRHMLRAVKR